MSAPLFWGDLPVFTNRMPVDFIEHDDRYELLADVPGLRRTEVQLNVGQDGQLTISTSPAKAAKVESHKVLRKERLAEGVSRGFVLPEGADTASVQAGLKDGVLHVVMKKKPLDKAAVRRIPISKL